jgi:hypothetical protein
VACRRALSALQRYYLLAAVRLVVADMAMLHRADMRGNHVAEEDSTDTDKAVQSVEGRHHWLLLVHMNTKAAVGVGAGKSAQSVEQR